MSQASSSKPVKIPGPDHPIAIAQHPSRVIVSVAGHMIADTRAALSLREANYPEVLYVPRNDVDMPLLRPTDHTTYCPYKGDASYFSIPVAGALGENAVWSYEMPHPSAQAIKDFLAFYTNQVEVIQEH
jgi:uncharacterized protein (DUF427 family)